MTEYIQYKGAGMGNQYDNNAKEVCDWIHSRIKRKMGHGARRVFWIYDDNSIEIELTNDTALTLKLGDYITWVELEIKDLPNHGYFEVVTGSEREHSWAMKHRLGPSVNETRNGLKRMISDAYRGGRGETSDYGTLLRAEELLGVLEFTLDVLSKSLLEASDADD